jgi:CRISPR-associated endonuclease/helicase Cas3
MSKEFSTFFREITGGSSPHQWQTEFATQPECRNRLVPVGTGLGKTIGLAGAWFFHRVVLDRADWPRRLIWCLPMRVLVEQTLGEFTKICSAYATGVSDRSLQNRLPTVHSFLGGLEPGVQFDGSKEIHSKEVQWHLHPERNTMLVGTQDMLLSRALGRGFGAGRARWPIDFGLLNSDCLWVFDEVQLMGVSAVTGSQLQSFRAIADGKPNSTLIRQSYSWWASATLRERWIETVDSGDVISVARSSSAVVPHADRKLPVFSATKPVTVQVAPSKIKDAAKSIAAAALEMHRGDDSSSEGCVTLVVVNRVDSAIEVANQVRKQLSKDTSVEVKLIHSRFRGRERELWRGPAGNGGFLSKEACQAISTNRIIVATQVVEAGVDISAGNGDRGGLITELAPWSSLVQRFGRAARYGGNARVVVIDRQLTKSDAAPYHEAQLAAAREVLGRMKDVGLQSLALLEATLEKEPDLDETLFQLDYTHLITKQEFEELFDNSQDVTGDDIDISRFIREDDEANAMVAWIETESSPESNRWKPSTTYSPSRVDLCPVPFLHAREWLFDTKRVEGFRKIRTPYAFVWDFEDGRWNPLRRKEEIRPGSVVLVDHRIGGYDSQSGFAGSAASSPVSDPIPLDIVSRSAVAAAVDQADRSQASDPLSVSDSTFQSIADHGREVGELAGRLATEVGLPASIGPIMQLVGFWHDWGKSHPVFQGNIFRRPDAWKNAHNIAKAPKESWRHYAHPWFNFPEKSLADRYERLPHGRRRGFRHELATVLGIFELLARANQRHGALLGADTSLDELSPKPEFDRAPDNLVVDSLNRLSPEDFNLLVYLLASHHGKVRCQLLMTEHDQDFRPPYASPGVSDNKVLGEASLPIRGVRSGDQLPPTEIFIDGKNLQVPAVVLNTSLAAMGWNERYGASWAERAISVVARHGVFNLSLMEAIVRAADVRCSQVLGVDTAFAEITDSVESTEQAANWTDDSDDSNDRETIDSALGEQDAEI